MRFFNTEGPVVARKHYCIPPLERVNIAELLVLIAQERYFVLHAPRQTGKTSVLLALRDLLEAGGAGDYRCVYVNVEAAQAVREDVECVFRSKPITQSSANRSLIPFQADHPFQSMPITDSSSMPITFWLATGTVRGV